jgi:nucleoside-diphosphate-sugar epimerase
VTASAVQEDARLRPDASEVLVLQSDPSKARELLGWEPQTSLEDGIRATIDWLRAHPDPSEAERVSI